ncbi:type II toxin-antitoxin system HicB family antitoxin [Pseudanabaena sp. FACHB-1277]|uniref:Type II toxin-antitoxin system HicB family antitoxin n=1 Tax=Pseudanabaena cinerea FACHB-1277 TaxID=2949581 RepID=A0A926US02_9CYAN|nr:type II toxin-antitoxin system HicB family antitoxin [Pseudanabaena cinerea]MBD2150174.1 type II toxin-antitoxin system HicB family antitoxin [Pseudanabaena cinerea FACHB-1277]
MKTQTKPKTLEEYLNLNYPITLYPEPDGGYTVMIVDLVGCLSQGDSLEEAVANIQEAKHAWLETAWECGDDIPLPNLQIKSKTRKLA